MIVRFVRHGESLANVARVIANRGAGPGLSETGRQQGNSLAHGIRGRAVSRILSSPLSRARQTAAALTATLGVPLEVAPELREFDCGELEGRSDAAAWAQHMDLIRAWLLGGDAHRRIEGGESLLDIRDRVVPFVTAVFRCARPRSGDVIFVGHAGLFAATLPFLLPGVDHAFAWSHPIGKTGQVICDWRCERPYCLRWDTMDLAAAVGEQSSATARAEGGAPQTAVTVP